MKRNGCLLLLCMLAVYGLLPFASHAQVFYGSIVGTVGDPSGSSVPHATVTITNKVAGVSRDTVTDEAGRYTFLNVPPGDYDVKIGAPGFRTLTKTETVAINTVTRADARLEVGQITEQVTVAGTAVMLQTDKSDVRHELTGQTVQNIPLPGYRNYQSLIELVPGASPPAFQNAAVDTPGRALRSFVNGTATNNNNTLVDGAVNINIWLPHHVAYVQPVESIETVNMTTGSFDAEQGMAGGMAVTLATKSGTNDFHGVAFWFHNDDHLNSAGTYFRSSSYVKPLYVFNQGGGNIGGPIRKNRAFFFFNFERTMERQGSFLNASVAPADFRAGDFSKWTQYSIIYDPNTATQANNAQRTPFPNNMVPQNRWNPIFPAIYKDVPLPNQTSPTDVLNLSGNYGTSGVQNLVRNQYDTKINYNISRKFILWGKFSRMDAPVQGKYIFGDLGGPAIGTEGFGNTHTNLVTTGYNYVFSPSFLMDGVFGYTRMDQFVGIPNVDKNIGLDVWKIPGTNGGRLYSSDNRYGGAPQVSGYGFDYVGVGATWAPVWRHERAYTYQTNFSKILHAHEIRWGFEARRLELNHWQPETGNPRGSISFAAGATYNSAQDAQKRGTANSYAAALLGLVSSYSKSIQNYEMKTREWQLAWYVRDNWHISRKVTVNAGLRYEYYPLINRDSRGIERWDPATNLVYFGGQGSTPRDAGITVSKKLFAPRLGLAWRATEKTVFRAGYGLTYDPLPFGRPLRGIYPSTLTGSWNPTVGTYGWYNQINEGIPDIVPPDTSTGTGLLPLNIDMGPRSPYGGLIHRGYVQSWNATLERNLPGDMVGSVAYVATRTIHQLIDVNINVSGPGQGTTTANLPLAKTQGRTIAMNMWDGWGYGAYNSLQATLNKGFGHGIFSKVAYTYGKAMSFADEDGWVGLPSFNWGPMINRNYAPTGYDRTHSFTAAWNYELPFGRGKKFGITNKFADAVLGGWKFTGTFLAYSGTAFTVSGSNSSLMCGGSTACTQTAFQIGDVKKLDGRGPQNPYYDPASFRDPLFYFNAANPQYIPGTVGRNSLRGPGYWRINPGIYKNFKVREKLNAEFRVESTNFTNTPAWSNPSGSSASQRLLPSGALDTSIANPTGNFMSITGASTGRDIRFGLRLSF